MNRINAKNIHALQVSMALAILFLFIVSCNDHSYDSYRCETVKGELYGAITRVYGRASYMGIDVSSGLIIKSVSFDVDKILYKKGFGEYRIYNVGDSIFKKANSNKVMIKKGDSICIFTLSCNDFFG